MQAKSMKKKQSTSEFDYTMKIVIIGDSGVGKSSLLCRYQQGKFMENYAMTIGINYVYIVSEVQGLRIKLQIWDTAGQEKYKTITQNYYRNSNGAIISFSIDCRDSFESVRHWIDELTQAVKQTTQIMLIGTKSDLIAQRKVSYEEAAKFAQQNDIPYLECSAKSGQSVHEVFQRLSEMMKHKFIDEKLKTGGEEPEQVKGGLQLVNFGRKMHNRCCQQN